MGDFARVLMDVLDRGVEVLRARQNGNHIKQPGDSDKRR